MTLISRSRSEVEFSEKLVNAITAKQDSEIPTTGGSTRRLNGILATANIFTSKMTLVKCFSCVDGLLKNPQYSILTATKVVQENYPLDILSLSQHLHIIF